MAPMTRSASREVRDYLVKTMLDEINNPGETVYSDSLKDLGVFSFEDLLTLPDDDIATMVKKTVEGNITVTTDLTCGHKRLVSYLVHWLNTKKIILNSRDSAEWLVLTADDFNTFRTKQGNVLPTQQVQGITSVRSAITTPLNLHQESTEGETAPTSNLDDVADVDMGSVAPNLNLDKSDYD